MAERSPHDFLLKAVSVVIPSKDGTATLLRALDSLLPNAAFIEEVIVVLSNSPAAFHTFCNAELNRYQCHFSIKLVDSGAPSNGSIARNAGIDAARAPFIAFLDDDDEWMPERLASYADCIAARRLSGDFVVFSTVISCREDRTHWSLFPNRTYRGEAIDEFILSQGGGAQTSSLLLPRALAQRVRFDPTLARHQDYDFCIRLARTGAEFHHIERALGYWYQRGDVVAKGNTWDFCEAWILSYRQNLSRRAVSAYIEKELFAVARATKQWRRFFQFTVKHLPPTELALMYTRLTARMVSAAWRRLQQSNYGPFTGTEPYAAFVEVSRPRHVDKCGVN